jgi:LuxR family maltose regulon positive regulatory protein
MKPSILYTKLQRPPVAPDIVSRNRLTQLLDEGRKRPLSLISAPAGYGKSTLASHWTATYDGPCGWVSLDKSDNDLRQFLNYLVAAIQPLFPRIELSTKALLAADRLPDAVEMARHLLNDLHQLPASFILVLDDYHSITAPSIHDLVAALLAHPAQALHLVLVTRRDPPLPIAAMRGRGLVTEIRMSDLRFTSTETAAFLNRTPTVAVDDTTAALLETKIEGWAAGLRLAALYLHNHKDLDQCVGELSGNSRHIAEYLVSEVLARQDPEIAAYLAETSILDRFCAPLCRRLHQKPSNGRSRQTEIGAEQFIQWLMKANLFVIALDDKGDWFRYHHLFQDFLRGVLRKKNTPDRIAELHRTAGHWFAENDLIEEAIRHLLAAGDTAAAIRLVVGR